MHALNSHRPPRPSAWALAAKVLGMLLLILGSKFLMLRFCSSPLPVFDQWQAEGQCLLQPLLRGTLHFADLFAPWAQHRIVWTRLLFLGLFELNGQWDTQVEAIAAEVIHAATAGFLAVILIRRLGQEWEDAVLLCLVLLFGLPFAQEDTLSGGFNSQYYFLLLFGVVAIWGLALHRPGSSGWWMGVAAAIMAWFSIATGGLPSLAVAAWMALRLARRDGTTRENWTTLGVALILGLGGLCLNLGIPQRTELHPASAGELLVRFAGLLGWPNPTAWAAPVAYAPFACLLWRLLRGRRNAVQAEAFLIPLGFFILLNTAALAYARNHYGGLGVSRYMDFLCFGALVNFSCLLLLMRQPSNGKATVLTRAGFGFLTVAWIATTGVGLSRLTSGNVTDDLPFVKSCGEHEVGNVNALIARHDVRAFVAKDPFDIMCEKPQIAVSLLQDAAILRILPWQVRLPLVLEAASASPQVRKVISESGDLAKTGWLLEPVHQGQSVYFRSRSITGSHLPYLRFPEISDLYDGIFMGLVAEPSGEITWLPQSEQGSDWHSILLRAPVGPFHVEAVIRAGSSRRLAFSYPREVGSLSAWVEPLLNSGMGLTFAGLGVWLGAVFWRRLGLDALSILWREKRDRSNEVYPPAARCPPAAEPAAFSASLN